MAIKSACMRKFQSTQKRNWVYWWEVLSQQEPLQFLFVWCSWVIGRWYILPLGCFNWSYFTDRSWVLLKVLSTQMLFPLPWIISLSKISVGFFFLSRLRQICRGIEYLGQLRLTWVGRGWVALYAKQSSLSGIQAEMCNVLQKRGAQTLLES